mmetsp:Transcript_50703/g.130647  ORF Transcript_50703/g.130647 Transcript_50703/m.130647 type:complete len:423 (-) Transcript_50703:100-1368(-)
MPPSHVVLSRHVGRHGRELEAGHRLVPVCHDDLRAAELELLALLRRARVDAVVGALPEGAVVEEHAHLLHGPQPLVLLDDPHQLLQVKLVGIRVLLRQPAVAHDDQEALAVPLPLLDGLLRRPHHLRRDELPYCDRPLMQDAVLKVGGLDDADRPRLDEVRQAAALRDVEAAGVEDLLGLLLPPRGCLAGLPRQRRRDEGTPQVPGLLQLLLGRAVLRRGGSSTARCAAQAAVRVQPVVEDHLLRLNLPVAIPVGLAPRGVQGPGEHAGVQLAPGDVARLRERLGSVGGLWRRARVLAVLPRQLPGCRTAHHPRGRLRDARHAAADRGGALAGAPQRGVRRGEPQACVHGGRAIQGLAMVKGLGGPAAAAAQAGLRPEERRRPRLPQRGQAAGRGGEKAAAAVAARSERGGSRGVASQDLSV